MQTQSIVHCRLLHLVLPMWNAAEAETQLSSKITLRSLGLRNDCQIRNRLTTFQFVGENQGPLHSSMIMALLANNWWTGMNSSLFQKLEQHEDPPFKKKWDRTGTRVHNCVGDFMNIQWMENLLQICCLTRCISTFELHIWSGRPLVDWTDCTLSLQKAHDTLAVKYI